MEQLAELTKMLALSIQEQAKMTQQILVQQQQQQQHVKRQTSRTHKTQGHRTKSVRAAVGPDTQECESIFFKQRGGKYCLNCAMWFYLKWN